MNDGGGWADCWTITIARQPRWCLRVINRSVVVVRPKQPFLDWLHRVDPTSGELTLKDLRRDPNVYLLPTCDTEEQMEGRLKHVCQWIFEGQLNGWYTVEEVWPADRSMKVFREWFEYEFHSMAIDLTRRPLISEDL